MEKIDDQGKSTSGTGRLILGIILLFFGGMIISRHFHWFPFEFYNHVFSLPAILILVGVLGLIFGRNTILFSVITLIGVFLMFGNVYDYPFDLRRLLLPFIFILIGLMLIFKRTGYISKGHTVNKETDTNNFLDDTLIFGGGKKNLFTDKFTGGRITSIFGGAEYNLTKCKLDKKINVIDVFHIFGGSKIIVPGDWKVKIDVLSIFGGYSDKRYNVTQSEDDKELHIKGVVIFGGGDVASD